MKTVITAKGKKNITERERNMLIHFAVLPSGFYSFDELLVFFDMESRDDVLLFDALYDMEKNGWVERHADKYIMRPLVRTTLQKQLQPTVEDCGHLLTHFSQKLFVKDKNDEGYESRRHLLHYLASRADALHENNVEVARLTTNLSIVYYKLGEIDESLRFNRRAIEAGEASNYEYLHRAYHNMADLYYKKKHYRKSLEYSLRYVYMRERAAKTHDDYHELAYQYYNVAVLYYDLGDYSNAKKYIDKVVVLDKQILDEEHPNFLYDLKLQKRIHFAYNLSRHVQRNIKYYLAGFGIVLIAAILYAIFR